MELINKIDKLFPYQKGIKTYPLLLIENPKDGIEIVLEGLPTGELPLVLLMDNEMIKVGGIDKSPKTINYLLQIIPITIVISETVAYEIKNINQLLDMEGFDWTR